MIETSEEVPIQDSPFARKLSAFVRLSNSDLSVISDLFRRRRRFSVGIDMIHQGQTDQSAFVLASGWACSYKILSSGSRQIVDFQVPGDFLGLRSMLFRTSDHNVEPVTPVQASEVKQKDLLNAFSQTPRLATAVLWAASRDEAMVVEHLVNLGRRTATERMAHFLLEMGARLRLVGMADRKGYACPLSQYLLADALGLSAVHVNRVLRELREEGLVTFQKGRVVFADYDRLVEFLPLTVLISTMMARCFSDDQAAQPEVCPRLGRYLTPKRGSPRRVPSDIRRHFWQSGPFRPPRNVSEPSPFSGPTVLYPKPP